MVKKKLQEIDHLVVRYHRGVLTDKNQRKRMIHLQKGLLGESEIVKLLKHFFAYKLVNATERLARNRWQSNRS